MLGVDGLVQARIGVGNDITMSRADYLVQGGAGNTYAMSSRIRKRSLSVVYLSVHIYTYH